MAGANTSGDDASLIEVVDELLAVAADRARVDSIHAALNDAAANPAGMRGLLPAPVLRLAFVVASPPLFHSLVEFHPDLAERLAAAREFVMTSFPGLALALVGAATAWTEPGANEGRAHTFIRNLRTMGRPNGSFGESRQLAPAVRLVVTDETGEPVLDQVIDSSDWSGLLLLAESSLTVLKESVNGNEARVQSEMVGEFLEALPETRSTITALLHEIEEAAAFYKTGPGE